MVCADAETEEDRITQRNESVIMKESIKTMINRFYSSAINQAS